MFETIAGNEPIKTYLSKALLERRLPQSLLFSGPDGIGKSLFAKELALHLLQSDKVRIEKEIHPDYHPIRPEGKSGNFAIETLRKMIDQVHEAPFEAPAKVFILFNAERMQPAAANALLKTLEEPNPDTTILLITSRPKDLLPTILSRMTKLSFQPLSLKEVESALEKMGLSKSHALFSQGSMGRAVEYSKSSIFNETVISLLSNPLPYYVLSEKCEKLSESLSKEDPVLKNREIDQIFATVLIWFRDQHAAKLGVKSLLYSDLSKSTDQLISLEKLEKRILETKMAISLNLKISTCLENFFSEIVL